MTDHSLNNFSSRLRIFWMLQRRDMLILWRQLRGILIDSGVVFFTQLIVFGKLFPLMGMPVNLAAPLYLGATISFVFFAGYSYAMRLKYEAEFSGYLAYQQTLPLPKRWLFAQQVLFFLVEASIITIPQITIGIYCLPEAFSTLAPNWPLVIYFFVTTLTFFSLFMTFLSYHYNFDYFTTSIWPRRLSPMFAFSVMFISSWKAAYAFSPRIGYALLLNPTTYFAEGLRGAILGSNEYLAWPICFGAGLAFMAVTIVLLARAIKKRLDPV